MVTSKCLFPHDLNFAIKQLEIDLGNRFLDNQKLLKDAESVLPGMDALVDEGNALLDTILAKNGAGTPTSSDITSSANAASKYGLLPDKPTTEEQEKYLFSAGIIVCDGVWYFDGSKSTNIVDRFNIDILRRLYFALGNDLKKTEDVLNNSTKTVFIYDLLAFVSRPPRGYPVQRTTDSKASLNQYSADEMGTLIGVNQLTEEDMIYTVDYKSIALTKQFYLKDTRKPSYTIDNNNAVVTNVFHLNGVDNSISALDRYRNLTELGNLVPSKTKGTYVVGPNAANEFNSIVDGTDFVISNSISLLSTLDDLKLKAANTIKKIEFLETQPTKNFKEVNKDIDYLIYNHIQLLSLYFFQVTTELPKDILTNLRKKHSDDKIKYLLERRQEIKGIYFDPPDDDFISYVSQVLSAYTPGSTAISNAFINQTNTNSLDQSKLLGMFQNILDAQISMGTETKNINSLNCGFYGLVNNTSKQGVKITPLTLAKAALQKYTQTDLAVSVNIEETVYQGQPSMASPSTIIAPQVDISQTMDMEQRKNNVLGSFKDLYDMYPASVAVPLSEVITATADLFDKAFKGIDAIIAQAENTLFTMLNRLNSWLSKHASLTGMGNFNSSLLKCAINWDIGISTDLLDMLYNYIMKFIGQVIAFLTKIKTWIADILTKLLCFPVNILNSFLGKIQMALPSVCKLPKFDLGTKLNDSLTKLLNCASVKGIILQSLDKDLLKLKLNVSAAPDRLGQFKNSALCESAATSNFMNASNLNVSAGVSL